MKIQRRELTQISEGIDLYDAQKLLVFRLTLLLTENKKLIKEQSELFEEAKNKLLPLDEIKTFQEKQRELGGQYWKKDEKGEFVMEEKNGQSVHVITDRIALDAKLETLNEKYKKVFKRYDDGVKEAEAFLDEEIEIPIRKITDIEHVKKLSPKTLAALAPIIECDLPEIILEEKGDALKTADIERIMKWCKIV